MNLSKNHYHLQILLHKVQPSCHLQKNLKLGEIWLSQVEKFLDPNCIMQNFL